MSAKSLKSRKPVPSPLDQIMDALEPLIEEPGSTVLFFDLDGTLAPIMPRPDEVAVPPEITKLLRKLVHRYLSVCVVSGRPATEAKRITGNSEIVYIGNHGFETMVPGHAVVVCDEAQPYMAKIRELHDYSHSVPEMVDSGVWVEDKGATLSFHYRRAHDPVAAREMIEKVFIPKVEKLGLDYYQGRMVVEVRPPVEINKGVAVGRLIDRLGATKELYAGDDTTDIDAFKELRKRRRRKHKTIGVGVISDEMPRELPRYCDLLVARMSGMELVLQLLAGEEL